MEQKYQIRYDLYKRLYGRMLYRIQALKSFNDVKEGELGGYVGSEKNLSHDGNCWIYDEACVFDEAQIKDNARVYDNAMVYGVGSVHDNARIYGNSQVFGCAYVRNNANVLGNAKVHGNCIVSGNVIVYGDANIDCYTFTDKDTYDVKDVCGNLQQYFNKNMQNESVKIQVPDGYEIDKENSTFDCIKLKKKNEVKEIHTWDDLVVSRENKCYDWTYGLAIKSLIAEFKIKELMPYFGGAITDKEWENKSLEKTVIHKLHGDGKPYLIKVFTYRRFLAFHTEKDACNFMSYPDNVQLVKDYLMID